MAALAFLVNPDVVGVGTWTDVDDAGVTSGIALVLTAGNADITVQLSMTAAALVVDRIKEQLDG